MTATPAINSVEMVGDANFGTATVKFANGVELSRPYGGFSTLKIGENSFQAHRVCEEDGDTFVAILCPRFAETDDPTEVKTLFQTVFDICKDVEVRILVDNSEDMEGLDDFLESIGFSKKADVFGGWIMRRSATAN